MVEAGEKIDLVEAVKTSMLITSSFAFTLGSIYAMVYFNLFELDILRDIPFVFLVFSMLITFNLAFSLTLIDQLRS